MRLKNHKIEGVPFLAAAFTGGEITPEIVVLHDTAGRLDKGNSAAYLASANVAKASVHFVIERDGTVTQLVPTNRMANHAGKSSYHGRSGCNAFSIGIELVNPGKMLPVNGAGGEAGRSWFGVTYADDPAAQIDIAYAETTTHGEGMWMSYPEGQIAALLQLLTALFEAIPTLTDITTHWYVSPGRKVDVNPLFPLRQIRDVVLGQDDPAELAAEYQSAATEPGRMICISDGVASLNMRRWPSFNPNVIATIPGGTKVPVERAGTFCGRDWLRVIYDGQEGWIVAAYTTPIKP